MCVCVSGVRKRRCAIWQFARANNVTTTTTHNTQLELQWKQLACASRGDYREKHLRCVFNFIYVFGSHVVGWVREGRLITINEHVRLEYVYPIFSFFYVIVYMNIFANWNGMAHRNYKYFLGFIFVLMITHLYIDVCFLYLNLNQFCDDRWSSCGGCVWLVCWHCGWSLKGFAG